ASRPLLIDADAARPLPFYVPGAGGAPPAAAVLGDIVDVARGHVTGGRAPRGSTYAMLPIIDSGLVPNRYHMRLRVADRPGVLSEIATVVANHGVSIARVRQTPGGEGRAGLIIAAYCPPHAPLPATLTGLRAL